MLKISQLYIYPIKSLAGIAVQSAKVTDRGLKHDRRWMLVDEKNDFLTIREYPKMTLLQPEIIDNQLIVRSIKNPESSISIQHEIDSDNLEEVVIWNATVKAKVLDIGISDWFSTQLGCKCKLVYMPESSMRPVDTTSGYHPANKFTSFADAYPFLIVGEASLQDLNNKLAEPISMARFRPNIVFSDGYAFQEDDFEDFTINGLKFTGLENCARCQIPNVDPTTGIINPNREPLKTLSKYRNRNKNIEFGRNLVHSGTGQISIGDEILIDC